MPKKKMAWGDPPTAGAGKKVGRGQSKKKDAAPRCSTPNKGREILRKEVRRWEGHWGSELLEIGGKILKKKGPICIW